MYVYILTKRKRVCYFIPWLSAFGQVHRKFGNRNPRCGGRSKQKLQING